MAVFLLECFGKLISSVSCTIRTRHFRPVQGGEPLRLRRQVRGAVLLPAGLHLRLPDGDNRVLRPRARVPRHRVRGARLLHRLPLQPPGLDQHP